MSWIEALVLGCVQGVSEFLPISSSGHLILVPWLLNWGDPGLSFSVFLHLGTTLALLIYFFGDLWGIFIAGLKSIIERRVGYDMERMLFWWIFWGTLPAVVAGLSFGDWIEAHLRSPLLVAFFLAAVGFLIFWIDLRFPANRQLEEMTRAESFLIGLAQACALIPGVSRSGSTIAMARRLGFSRHAAARFSFLLSVPIIVGALVLESRHLLGRAGSELGWGYLMTGLLASFFSGLICIHLFLQFLKHASLKVFAWY
ncbi:MAG: undecaprenyl-diphosphate phosphatase, partial [Proteobacteria bacterium]|nr:undecaprenyl-diphosphate phosphatase [Pseudomonadota bacterium]